MQCNAVKGKEGEGKGKEMREQRKEKKKRNGGKVETKELLADARCAGMKIEFNSFEKNLNKS